MSTPQEPPPGGPPARAEAAEAEPAVGARHGHGESAVDAERRGWYELAGLLRSLTREECLEPGYYHDPDWTVRDVVAHLGTWLAQAEVELERITVGTYDQRDIDVDGLNRSFLSTMRDQPWDVAWVQLNAGRTRMIDVWAHLDDPSDDARWWISKAGAEHYAEHLDRLRDWVGELIRRREGTGPT